jgi:hypothetical protein
MGARTRSELAHETLPLDKAVQRVDYTTLGDGRAVAPPDRQAAAVSITFDTVVPLKRTQRHYIPTPARIVAAVRRTLEG